MDNKLNIALIQSDLLWENPNQNRDFDLMQSDKRYCLILLAIVLV